MSTAAVVADGLSKRYRLGASREQGYRTLRDALARLGRRAERPSAATREFWALRDVSFRIDRGEALGIIGHNGAGKSTLLKLLSRVTEPTLGRAELRGRVASLLEVGTGFHPELTGRENIFLNGAILGMTRVEIRRSFDAIVAFAEVERFLDTPVKYYSSGMHVRLGFAVAAHLTPEILIVDEVLAVGDHDFQRRCLGRMSDVAQAGRTVLFVSHNLHAIEELCPRTLLLRNGVVEQEGPSRDVIARYLARRSGESEGDLEHFADRQGHGRARITGLELLAAAEDRPLPHVDFLQPFRVRVRYRAHERLQAASIGLAILAEGDQRICVSATEDAGLALPSLQGEGALECIFEQPNLLPGLYRWELWIIDGLAGDYADRVRGVGRLEVRVGAWHAGSTATLAWRDRGHVYFSGSWRHL